MNKSVSGLGPVANSCERGNKPSVSIKAVKFLRQMGDYQFIKPDAAP